MLAVVLLPGAVTLAQEGPPQPSLTRGAAPWVGYAVMFLLVALVLGVSLLPSKRGHQD